MLDGMRQHAGSWIVKILFAIIILVFVFAFGSGTLSNRASGGAVLAYVNESPILIKDFDMAYQRAIEAVRRQNPGVSSDDLQSAAMKQQVFQRMVNDVLITDEANRLGITVSKDEVRARILEIPAFRNQEDTFDNTVYQAVLRGSHLNPAEFEAEMARQIREEKLRKHLGFAVSLTEEEAYDMFRFAAEQARVEYIAFDWQDYADKIVPGDAEIEAYYKTNEERFRRPATANFSYLTFTPKSLASRQEVSDEEIKAYYEANSSLFERPEMVSARHILIKLAPNASDKDVEAARKKLVGIQAKLAKGAEFSELAEKYSEGPSAVRGGDLGAFPRGSMVKPFEDAAFNLESGKVSKPVRTQFGWHLIKVDDKRAAGVKSLDEARSEIRATIAEEKAASEMGDMLDQALEQILVGDDAAKISKDLDLPLNQTGPMTQEALVSRLGLTDEDAQALFDLSLGTATDNAINVDNGYMIAFKIDSTESAIAPLEQVREQIVEVLKRQGATARAQEKANSVLAELRDPAKAKAAIAQYGKKLEMSEKFGRQGFIPGLGMNPALVEAAFVAEEGEWLEKSYAVNSGMVIARLADRIEPSAELWEQQKEFVMGTLTQTKQREMFGAFLQSLRDKAETKLVEARVLQ